MLTHLRNELARALRALRNIPLAMAKARMGGTFYISVDDGPWVPAKNTMALEGLDAIYSTYFNNGSPPTAFYIAPFTSNVTPSSSITAATFTAALGEYTGYTQSTRVPWVADGNSVAQTVTNSAAPAVFTIGASAVTITGAAFIASASAKGAVTGKVIAAALFGAANSLNPGSTLKIQYSLGASPA